MFLLCERTITFCEVDKCGAGSEALTFSNSRPSILRKSAKDAQLKTIHDYNGVLNNSNDYTKNNPAQQLLRPSVPSVTT